MVDGTKVAVRSYPMAVRLRDSTRSRERDREKGRFDENRLPEQLMLPRMICTVF